MSFVIRGMHRPAINEHIHPYGQWQPWASFLRECAAKSPWPYASPTMYWMKKNQINFFFKYYDLEPSLGTYFFKLFENFLQVEMMFDCFLISCLVFSTPADVGYIAKDSSEKKLVPPVATLVKSKYKNQWCDVQISLLTEISLAVCSQSAAEGWLNRFYYILAFDCSCHKWMQLQSFKPGWSDLPHDYWPKDCR